VYREKGIVYSQAMTVYLLEQIAYNICVAILHTLGFRKDNARKLPLIN